MVGFLAYLLIFFVLKHGIQFDWGSILLLFKETAYYPVFFIKELLPYLGLLYPVYVSFILAILIELLLSPTLQGTFWTAPFPYMLLFYIVFLAVNFYRSIILIAHFKKQVFVKNFLEASSWKSFIKKMHISFHILHAYLTGMLCDLAIPIPALIFWNLTSPTYLREAALIIFFIILQYNYYRIENKKIVFSTVDLKPLDNISVSSSHLQNGYQKNTFLNTLATLLSASGNYKLDDKNSFFEWYGINHTHCHYSRFYFTVFHGHHHDAIPSSLIASSGIGLLEGVHRGLSRFFFFQSATILLLLKVMPTSLIDMTLHQYIPGVFPYSKLAIKIQDHHGVHHFFSILPLHIGIQNNIDIGYKVANPKAIWFAESVVKYEKIDPALASSFYTISKEQIEQSKLKPTKMHTFFNVLFSF